MRIKSVQLKNFRCFEDKEFFLSESPFTVFIGNNGTGKTTILDAVSVAIGGYLSLFDEVKKTRHFHNDEARIVKYQSGNFESQFPLEVSCSCEIQGQLYAWKRALNGKKNNRTGRVRNTELINFTNDIEKQVREGSDIILPVVAFYGTGRLWSQSRERSVDLFESGSRFLGYTDCLNPNTNEKLFTKWFKKWVMIELQEGTEQGVLTAVRKSVINCLKNIDESDDGSGVISIDYNLKSDDILVGLENGKILPFRMLSDGYRNTIGMVADIAYRMALLNPHLGGDASKETPGVVAIDELDMHLHPKWQRDIVENLKKTFPKVQFIATTHSPFIIQTLDPEELVVLDHVQRGDFSHKSIEDVVEGVMGIDLPQMSQRRKKMLKVAEQYFALLRQMKGSNSRELQELRTKLDKLTEPFSDDVAYVALLRQERIVAESELQEPGNETGR